MPAKSWLPVLLIACAVVVALWELLSALSGRPQAGFALTAESFVGFAPREARWSINSVPIPAYDPAEPNILCFQMVSPAGQPVSVRLVHGYNMPMCMKIKGYAVSLLREDLPGAGCQVWRLVSQTGQGAVWITSMLRSGSFGPAGVDVRSMPFPRIDVVDAVDWSPQGLSRESLRHPWSSLRLYLRQRWNASRCSVLVFLGLRAPPSTSDKLLTLVAASNGFAAGPDEAAVAADVQTAHDVILRDLQRWRSQTNSVKQEL